MIDPKVDDEFLSLAGAFRFCVFLQPFPRCPARFTVYGVGFLIFFKVTRRRKNVRVDRNVIAHTIEPTKALTKCIDGRHLRDENIKVNIGTDFDRLGGYNEEAPSRSRALWFGTHTRKIPREIPITIKGTDASNQKFSVRCACEFFG